MQKVLIDAFIVPEESKAAFLERTRGIQNFLKTLPGFITTAVWENEEAIGNAKKAVAAEFQRQNFNPQELMKQLKVEAERGIYERFPY